MCRPSIGMERYGKVHKKRKWRKSLCLARLSGDGDNSNWNRTTKYVYTKCEKKNIYYSPIDTRFTQDLINNKFIHQMETKSPLDACRTCIWLQQRRRSKIKVALFSFTVCFVYPVWLCFFFHCFFCCCYFLIKASSVAICIYVTPYLTILIICSVFCIIRKATHLPHWYV